MRLIYCPKCHKVGMLFAHEKEAWCTCSDFRTPIHGTIYVDNFAPSIKTFLTKMEEITIEELMR